MSGHRLLIVVSVVVNEKYSLNYQLSFYDTDRWNKLTLSGFFRLLQEVAIQHADEFNTGAKAAAESAQTWVLNRVLININHYPAYLDKLTVETWATGLRGFKGFRDFRITMGDVCVANASSVWIYLDLEKRSIVKIPERIREHFPILKDAQCFEDLDRLKLKLPNHVSHNVTRSLRYDDVDWNQHVNNTAYFNFLQTALLASSKQTHPTQLYIQFQKEIPFTEERININLMNGDDQQYFSIGNDGDTQFTSGFLKGIS